MSPSSKRRACHETEELMNSGMVEGCFAVHVVRKLPLRAHTQPSEWVPAIHFQWVFRVPLNGHLHPRLRR